MESSSSRRNVGRSTRKRLKKAIETEKDVEGNEPKGRKTHPLEIELVLKEVFKCLNTKELMRCSSVNKKWNSEARTFIRQHRVCVADIGRKRDPCQDFQHFENVLKTMKIVPYNHIRVFNTWQQGRTACKEVECLSNSFQSVLSIQWKGVETQRQRFTNRRLCEAVKVVNEIITRHCGTIEKLRLADLPARHSSFLNLTNANSTVTLQFPQLKRLELGYNLRELASFLEHRFDQSINQVLQDLLTRITLFAPNLQAFDTLVTSTSFVNIMNLPDNLLKLIRKFCICRPWDTEHYAVFAKLLEVKPNLTELDMRDGSFSGAAYYDESQIGPRGYWGMMVRFFESCASATLQRLDTNIIVAALMTRAGLPLLPQVRVLGLDLSKNCCGKDSEVELRVLATIWSVFLRRVIPNVEWIYLTPCDRPRQPFWRWAKRIEVQEYFDQQLQILDAEEEDSVTADKALRKPLGLAVNLNYLTERFGTYFRRVTKLHVIGPFQKSSLFSLAPIHKLWPDLEELTLEEEHSACRGGSHNPEYVALLTELGVMDLVLDNKLFTLDALLCGISVQEALKLQKMKKEALQKVNVVPVMPAITSFAKLRKLNIELRIPRSKAWKQEWPGKVSAAQVFNRCPHIQITIHGPETFIKGFEGIELRHNNVSFVKIDHFS